MNATEFTQEMRGTPRRFRELETGSSGRTERNSVSYSPGFTIILLKRMGQLSPAAPPAAASLSTLAAELPTLSPNSLLRSVASVDISRRSF
jgi:hypothetical protein